MKKENELVQEILAIANITINGNNPWDIQVNDDQFYRRLLTNTDLSLGETYIEKLWDCNRVDELFYRILLDDLEKKALENANFWRSVLHRFLHNLSYSLLNHQTKIKSFIVGQYHYDLGNEIYYAMLDKRMVYSCAYWEGAKDLDEAQEFKLKLVCEKLNLQHGMTVLDVGCGWGGFAKYAAENYCVSVVGITISQQQFEYATAICKDLPIEIRLIDYRDLLNSSERFDRIISIGMFEHVGYKNYSTYMQVIDHCLKEDGLFLLHTIGANSVNSATSLWLNKYIFPNSQLPTISQISSSYEKIFVMEDWHNLGPHYDKTLMAWHHNFNQHWNTLSSKYDERFRRMWNYYLLSCAGSFRARHNQVWQILLSKKGLLNGVSRCWFKAK